MLFSAQKHKLRNVFIIACLVLAGVYSIIRAAELITADSRLPTAPNLKVAFIGDTGYGNDFEAVLTLIKNEGADAVLHQGDFDYANDPDGFFARIDAILGPDFPYFASVGNHDRDAWNTDCGDSDGCYAQFLKDRMNNIGILPDDPNLDDQMYAVTFRGLKLVFTGERKTAGDSIYAPYIQTQLADDNHIWKICSWHRNQNVLQIGTKDDETDWGVYETCKNNGAIIATAHEHSYHRTKTLTSMQNLTVDTSQHPLSNGVPGNPDQLLVESGKSFVFVSGLGGHDMRNQDRCQPTTYPYGGGPECNYIWANVYTSDQTGGAQTFGALFIIFNYNGDPNKAHGYFKTIDGTIIDEFEITANQVAYPPPVGLSQVRWHSWWQ